MRWANCAAPLPRTAAAMTGLAVGFALLSPCSHSLCLAERGRLLNEVTLCGGERGRAGRKRRWARRAQQAGRCGFGQKAASSQSNLMTKLKTKKKKAAVSLHNLLCPFLSSHTHTHAHNAHTHTHAQTLRPLICPFLAALSLSPPLSLSLLSPPPSIALFNFSPSPRLVSLALHPPSLLSRRVAALCPAHFASRPQPETCMRVLGR